MKKLFVLLLALTVVGVFAFAQDAAPVLKLSGYLNTGLSYSKTGSADDQVVQNGDDSATNGRFQINGAYANGDYGVNFRLRTQGDFTANPDVFTRRVYGWTKLAGGMVKVQAGRLGDYTWVAANAAYWNCFGNIDGPTGVQVQVMPMDGLNAGIFLPVKTTAATMSDTFKGMEIGAIYTAKDVFQVVGGYLGSAVSKASSIYFGGSALMVPNLTADVEGELVKYADSTNGSTFVFEALYYQMDAIKVGVQMSQQLFNSSSIKSQIYLGPEASYALNDSTTLGVTSNIALKDGKTGYGVGVYGKVATNKTSFIKVAAGMNGGDWAAGSGLVVFKTPGAWASISDSTTWALVDFVWNF